MAQPETPRSALGLSRSRGREGAGRRGADPAAADGHSWPRAPLRVAPAESTGPTCASLGAALVMSRKLAPADTTPKNFHLLRRSSHRVHHGPEAGIFQTTPGNGATRRFACSAERGEKPPHNSFGGAGSCPGGTCSAAQLVRRCRLLHRRNPQAQARGCPFDDVRQLHGARGAVSGASGTAQPPPAVPALPHGSRERGETPHHRHPDTTSPPTRTGQVGPESPGSSPSGQSSPAAAWSESAPRRCSSW